MCYDEARKHVLLLDAGGDGTVGVSDTWQWDGESWIQAEDTGPRLPVQTAYDAARQRVVATGRSGTWEWDGNSWTQVADTGPPFDFYMCALAYDDARERLVSVHWGSNSEFVITSEWDGFAWTQVGDTGPGPRGSFDTAYDSQREVVLLFGGFGLAGPVGDTWAWDGSVWEQVADIGPSPRASHCMAYDSERSRTVLFGGFTLQTPTGVLLNETWEWDGARWGQVQDIGPSPRRPYGFAYDRDRRQVVLFGGEVDKVGFGARAVNDTWEFGDFE